MISQVQVVDGDRNIYSVPSRTTGGLPCLAQALALITKEDLCNWTNYSPPLGHMLQIWSPVASLQERLAEQKVLLLRLLRRPDLPVRPTKLVLLLPKARPRRLVNNWCLFFYFSVYCQHMRTGVNYLKGKMSHLGYNVTPVYDQHVTNIDEEMMHMALVVVASACDPLRRKGSNTMI